MAAHSVPFFWTTQYGKSIRYCGHALQYQEIVFEGNVEALNFVGYYIHQGQMIAAVAMGRDPVVSAAAELLHANKLPSIDEIKNKKMDDLLKIIA